MTDKRKRRTNTLTERMVRNDDIFCSLLFDQDNGTLRVVDFRGGNFQTKHNHLEKVLLTEGMRKIFTLIERDDMNGWQRVGYHREGTIPGYYKRSDAYIMARIYDADWDGSQQSEDLPERKALLSEIKTLGKEISELGVTGVKKEQVTGEEARVLLRQEIDRMASKARSERDKASKGKSGKGAKKKKSVPPPRRIPDRSIDLPIFPQFSREVESYYFCAQNRRTKLLNVYGAEFQDCFGNAKVDVFFSPVTRAERAVALDGLNYFVEWLYGVGAVALFSLVRADDMDKNALVAAAGFRNSGWLNRQTVDSDRFVDLILWTRKLT